MVILCWNFARNTLKFYCFHFFSRALKFFYGCAEFARKHCKNCAKILLFYVFSKALKFFYWFAEFVLKHCKRCAQIFLFSCFLKNAEIFQRICWICAETLWEIRRKKRWIFFQDLYSKCAEIMLFFVFSRTLKLFYWCVEFVLKLCKKCAEILLLSRFLKSAETSLRMCWICVET